jgi:hypothetical protein
MPRAHSTGPQGSFYRDWVAYGGKPSDAERLDARHVEWLRALPAMALVNDRLLMHADALFYQNYGRSVSEVNAAFSQVLHSDDPREWDRILTYAGDRFDFDERNPANSGRARAFLRQFGGKQMIHGHTPIPTLNDEPLERVTRAWVYADGLVVDTDGWIYKGGAGFVHQVTEQENAASSRQFAETRRAESEQTRE